MYPSVSLAGVAFSTWRLVVLGAVALCWALLVPRGKRLGHDPVALLTFLVLELGVGTVGGHLFNRLIPLLFRTPGSTFDGLTVIGTTVATLSFAAWYVPRVLKVPLLPLFDAAAFTYPLALGLGRLGCLANGCCFGVFAPEWAARGPLRLLTIAATSYSPYTEAGRVLADAPAGARLWALPVMLALNCAATLVTAEVLFRNRARWRLPAGTVVAAVLAQETLGRFLLEFLRRDELVAGSRYNPWQLSLVALLAVFAVGLVRLLSRRDAAAPAPVPVAAGR